VVQPSSCILSRHSAAARLSSLAGISVASAPRAHRVIAHAWPLLEVRAPTKHATHCLLRHAARRIFPRAACGRHQRFALGVISALRASGRFSVMRARPWLNSYKTAPVISPLRAPALKRGDAHQPRSAHVSPAKPITIGFHPPDRRIGEMDRQQLRIRISDIRQKARAAIGGLIRVPAEHGGPGRPMDL